jgi:L-histidine Nalpha-methyltransferase
VALLRRIAHAAGPDALLVIGADSTRDPALLIPAYDDRMGVTAAFNLNLLRRINRELDGNFSLDAFRHEARFDAQQQRIEMHLVSVYTQRITVCGRPFMLAMGESIHTENSYKYSLPKFQQLAAMAGWSHRQCWMDAQSRFAVHVLARDVSKT